MVLFVYCLQSFITFKRATLVKAKFIMSFQDLAFKWSTLKLSDFDYDALNNNPEVKN